jgi:hypothetical protein
MVGIAAIITTMDIMAPVSVKVDNPPRIMIKLHNKGNK